jgi:hypothetical protein
LFIGVNVTHRFRLSTDGGARRCSGGTTPSPSRRLASMTHANGDVQESARPATPASPPLIVAVVIATLGGAVVFFEAAGVELVPIAVRSALLAAACTASMLYFVARYDERVHRRLDTIEELVDDRLKKAGYAEGFVAGAARQVPEQAVLRTVGGAR